MTAKKQHKMKLEIEKKMVDNVKTSRKPPNTIPYIKRPGIHMRIKGKKL